MNRRPWRGGPLAALGRGLALALALAAAPLPAQEAAAPSLADFRDELAALEGELETARLTEARMGKAISAASQLRSRFNGCRTDLDGQLQRLQAALAAVPPPEPGGVEVTSAELDKLKKQQARLESIRAECSVLAVRADTLVERLSARQRALLAERLLLRGPDGLSLVMANLRQPTDWFTAGQEFLVRHSGLAAITPLHLAGLALAAATAAAFGLALRRRGRALVARIEDTGFSARLTVAAVATLAGYAPVLLVLGALSLYLLLLNWRIQPLPFVNALTYGLLGLWSALTLTRILLAPVRPARQITPLEDEIARAMSRRIRVLLVVLLVAAMLVTTPLADTLPDHVYGLVRLVMLSLLVLNAGWLAWLVGRVPVLRLSGGGLRRALMVLLAVVGVGEWLGFNRLSDFLLLGLSWSALAGTVFWLISRVLFEVLEGLDSGRYGWQRAVRQGLGVQADQPVPGLAWLRLLVGLLLWLVLGLALLRIWGMSDAGLALVLKYLVDGFEVFGIRLVPAKVLAGLLLFALLLAAVRWGTGRFERHPTFRRTMDTGAREAVAKIAGYTGFILAALLALSTAGVNLSNLAIIAGALSVGIGFGLQNIVNNFVSGLILLFERPIRSGDWISLGATEGIVRRISVRSTEIQTFDRSTVIVPNADLIASQVTNWTLHDTLGRLIVPVGVAYGSDTALVKRLLLEVAAAHPLVVRNPALGAPMVYFLGFGDSALQFELRVILSDVNERLTVRSDLHFAIYEKFSEAGIEIPFPQRKVTVEHKGPVPPGAEHTPPEAFGGA